MNEQLKEAVSEAIRDALGGALDCGRAWSAWGVGTMSEDDFSPVADDSERVAEIADAVLVALAARQPVGQEPVAVPVAYMSHCDIRGKRLTVTKPEGKSSPLYPHPTAYAAPPAQGIDLAPRPMDTAPRDGTMIRLLVQFEENATEDTADPVWTIGACNDDNVGEDERVGWQFAGWCWTHDHFTEGKGTPVGWLPMVGA